MTGQHCIVLRFESVFPEALAGYEMHRLRRGGNLSHIDNSRTHQNQLLIGGSEWKVQLLRQIELAKQSNQKQRQKAALARHRPTEAAKIANQGPQNPWARRKQGPLREGILTVGADWFGGVGAVNWDPKKVSDFRALGLAFLQKHFGKDCVHARLDLDEDAPHIHFIIAVWAKKSSKRTGTQWVLQPSRNPLLKDYELAQTLAAEIFAKLGLERGQRRAEECRAAIAAGLEPPEPVRHIRPRLWQRERARAILKQKKRIEDEAAKLRQRQAKQEANERNLEARQKRTAALQTGIEALAEGHIVYRHGGADRPATLIAKGNKLRSPESRTALRETLKPVMTELLEVGEKLHRAASVHNNDLRAAIEADRQLIDATLKKLEAERKELLIEVMRVSQFRLFKFVGLPHDLKNIAKRLGIDPEELAPKK